MLYTTYHKDNVLRQRSEPVDLTNPDHIMKVNQAIPEMILEMLDNKGIGIAAPQIGVLLRLIVIKDIVAINPEITARGGTLNIDREGCLSIPDKVFFVPRSTPITVSYTVIDEDMNQTRVEKNYDGYLATVWQHEIDHLDGKLIDKTGFTLDYLSSKKIP